MSEYSKQETKGEVAPQPPRDEAPPKDKQGSRLSQEAAKYRVQLRDTEAQLATAQARLAEAQKQLAQDTLGSVLPKAEAFWKLGNSPADYFDEDGQLNTDQLKADATEFAKDLGITTADEDYSFEMEAGFGRVGQEPPTPAPTWQDVIKG